MELVVVHRAIPNLFVIGAAKAASSSLQRWLGGHPDIGVSSHAETRFLMDASDPLSRPDGYAATGLDGYGKYYPTRLAAPSGRYLLDVTPMYYYQEAALEVVPKIAGSRVIFIARRPSRRLYSLYRYAQNNMGVLPPDWTFSRFIQEVELGERSEELAARRMLSEGIEHCKYSEYLRQWAVSMSNGIGPRQADGARAVPDRMRILLFEELVTDPVSSLTDLAEWLEISASPFVSSPLPRENETIVVRSHSIHQLARRVRGRTPANLRRALKSSYLKLNSSPAAAELSSDDRATMARIDQELKPWNEELASMLGRDSLWD